MKKQKLPPSFKSPTHSISQTVSTIHSNKRTAGNNSYNSSIIHSAIGIPPNNLLHKRESPKAELSSNPLSTIKLRGFREAVNTGSEDGSKRNKPRYQDTHPSIIKNTLRIKNSHKDPQFSHLISNAKSLKQKQQLLDNALGSPKQTKNVCETQNSDLQSKQYHQQSLLPGEVEEQIIENNENDLFINLPRQTIYQNEMKVDTLKIQVTSPVHSSSSEESLLIRNSGALGDEDHHYLPLSPKSAGGSPVRTTHRRIRSKFYFQKVDNDQNILNKMLLGIDFKEEEEASTSLFQNAIDFTSSSNNYDNPIRQQSDNLFMQKFQQPLQATADSKNINRQLVQLDKQILQEQIKRSKVEKKLGVVDEENQKLRTMLNYLLNVEFQLS